MERQRKMKKDMRGLQKSKGVKFRDKDRLRAKQKIHKNKRNPWIMGRIQ